MVLWCDEVGHLTNDCLWCIFMASPISAMRGSSSIRGISSRGSGAHGRGFIFAQSDNSCS